MKSLTAPILRIILSIAITLVTALIVGVFVFGYQHLQGVGEETARHQADAAASEDSIAGLQRLQAELKTQTDAITKLNTLRSSNPLPQFDTSRSLRSIASQLNLPVTSISFIATPEGTGGPSDLQSPLPAEPNVSGASTPDAAWGKNSIISFEFGRKLSYIELINFLDAIETSTPKIRINGINLPVGSSRNSVDTGTLILELATL